MIHDRMNLTINVICHAHMSNDVRTIIPFLCFSQFRLLFFSPNKANYSASCWRDLKTI